MCGRYAIAGPTPAELRGRFPLGEDVDLRRRFNVAPTDAVPCVTTAADGAPRGELLRWGLVPHWARDASGAARMINARAETVADKPAFRDAFRRRRCLVVADGFYEWERSADGSRRAHLVTREDGAPFAFGGLAASWHGGEGEDGAPFAFGGLAASWHGGEDADAPLRTCAIVTTRANDRMAAIHERMPVILPPDAEEAWLDPATPGPVLDELLLGLPSSAIALRRVGPAVNSVRNDGPECQAPPPAEEPAAEDPPTLF